MMSLRLSLFYPIPTVRGQFESSLLHHPNLVCVRKVRVYWASSCYPSSYSHSWGRWGESRSATLSYLSQLSSLLPLLSCLFSFTPSLSHTLSIFTLLAADGDIEITFEKKKTEEEGATESKDAEEEKKVGEEKKAATEEAIVATIDDSDPNVFKSKAWLAKQMQRWEITTVMVLIK